MKIFNLIITSKNKDSIEKFQKFLNKTVTNNFKKVQKVFFKKGKRKFITILKSPHVNKSAQEQFEILTFSIQINISTMQPFKFLMLLKKVNTYLFPDVNLKLKLVHNKVKQITLKRKIFNVDNLKINKIKIIEDKKTKLRKIEAKNSENFLYLLDMYGI